MYPRIPWRLCRGSVWIREAHFENHCTIASPLFPAFVLALLLLSDGTIFLQGVAETTVVGTTSLMDTWNGATVVYEITCLFTAYICHVL
jgi:hypothetical protein